MCYNSSLRFHFMKELARAYIEEKVRIYSYDEELDSDSINMVYSRLPRKSHAEHAKDFSQQGEYRWTATFLNLDTTLSPGAKGETLAKAFDRLAEKNENYARDYSKLPDYAESYQSLAQYSKKIAQNLTRAAKRAQNS